MIEEILKKKLVKEHAAKIFKFTKKLKSRPNLG
jgi:hypothetical protein